MRRKAFLMGASSAALALSLGAAPGVAAAPPPAPPTAEPAASSTSVSEVVVTGSLIAGTPKTTAIPVQVVTQADLQKQGSPTIVELIKELPIVGSVLGDSNQFSTAAAGREGEERSICVPSAPPGPLCC